MNLAQGEKILKKYRQTKVNLAGYFVMCLLFAYLPLAFLAKYDLKENLGKIPELWVFFISAYFLNHIVLWKINYTLVTNQRLIIVQYYNLLHKHVTDLPKDKIVNVSYEKKGLFSTLFNYGNVVILQQSVPVPVILKHLPEPAKTKDEIISLIKPL